jgi:hypothetical protein
MASFLCHNTSGEIGTVAKINFVTFQRFGGKTPFPIIANHCLKANSHPDNT